MVPIRAFESTTGPRPRRLLGGIAVSAAAHAIVALLLVFDVLGPGGGFGLGIGPGFGIGAGGGAGLGEARRREIFSLQDLPTPTPPSDPTPDKTLHELLAPTTNPAVVVPHQAPAVGQGARSNSARARSDPGFRASPTGRLAQRSAAGHRPPHSRRWHRRQTRSVAAWHDALGRCPDPTRSTRGRQHAGAWWVGGVLLRAVTVGLLGISAAPCRRPLQRRFGALRDAARDAEERVRHARAAGTPAPRSRC